MRNASIVIMLLLLVSCGISEKKHNDLLKENKTLIEENKTLKADLDMYVNGESKLIAKVNKFYKEKDFKESKRNINLLNEKFPESNKISEINIISEKIAKIEKKEKEKQIEIAKEKEKLKNFNNTGIWSVNYYVDDFGEPTKIKYIGSNTISGRFSNTATQDSQLNLKFLITNPNKISVMLYEYAGNNPVKGYDEKYKVLVMDKDGNKTTVYGKNYSDRLTLGSSSSKKVHNIFLKGGTVKFKIYESDRSSTQYNFSVYSQHYNNAYRIYKERK